MDAPTPLRERKRQETRRALGEAARELALQHGVDGFTIDDIARRAATSPRTVFNYFDSKEAAIIGVDDDVIRELGERLLSRPARENPLTALRKALYDDDEDVAMVAQRWISRLYLVRRFPSLLPRHLAAVQAVEDGLVVALSARLQRDPAVDPYPTVVVSAWIGTFRSTMAWWWNNGQQGSLAAHLDAAFDLLRTGLTQPRAVRS
ncbi:MAG: TetR family transcriptional regulator [Actinobacteria bacterium]|nr:TetR family transcriptional regulator [Actinomycetota bacterium]